MTEGHVVLFSRMTEGQSRPGVKLLQKRYEMFNFDADCIYIVTVKKFEEDDHENVEVLFECAYGTREKARETYERAKKMFTPNAYVEFSVRRVVIVQGDGCPEEEMAYERLQELANEEFEAYWGERCEEYEEGCPVCDAYAARDGLGGMGGRDGKQD